MCSSPRPKKSGFGGSSIGPVSRPKSIAYCLREARIDLDEVQHIALNQNSRANLLRKLGYLMRHVPNLSLVGERLRNRLKRESTRELLAKAFPGRSVRAEFHNIEHHLAHLSSAFHVSPFEEAVVVSVDGFGDFASTAWGVGKGTDLKIEGRVYFPHSLGLFYQALTQYLGFSNYGDEYKVMGLAPYGRPTAIDAMRKIVRLQSDGTFELDLTYFRHHRERIAYQWTSGAPEFGDLFSTALERLLGPRRKPTDPLEDRHRDIACSVQAMYEEAFFHLVGELQRRSGLTDIALAGGCAMNSVAERQDPPHDAVPACLRPVGGRRCRRGDRAAFAVWHRLGGERSLRHEPRLLGPAIRSR